MSAVTGRTASLDGHRPTMHASFKGTANNGQPWPLASGVAARSIITTHRDIARLNARRERKYHADGRRRRSA